MKKAGAEELAAGAELEAGYASEATRCSKYDGPHDEEDNIDELIARMAARSSVD